MAPLGCPRYHPRPIPVGTILECLVLRWISLHWGWGQPGRGLMFLWKMAFRLTMWFSQLLILSFLSLRPAMAAAVHLRDLARRVPLHPVTLVLGDVAGHAVWGTVEGVVVAGAGAHGHLVL